MLHSSCKLRWLTRHRHASFTFWSACGGVIAQCIKKFLIQWGIPTMTWKSCVDAWSAKNRFVRRSHRFKMADSTITCHDPRGDYLLLSLNIQKNNKPCTGPDSQLAT